MEPADEGAAEADALKRAWNSYSSRLQTILDDLKEEQCVWTVDEFRTYLLEYRNRDPETVRRRVAHLAFMERHPVFPVQLHGTAFQMVSTFWLYVQHRKKVELKSPGAMKNDFKAIRALGDFLAIPEQVWPTAPTEPHTDERWIPSPEHVHGLLHANYTKNPAQSYENALVKALLAFDYLIGPRFPSEPHKLMMRDFQPDRHRIVITEPKKSGRRRTIGIEPEWICCSTRHPSLGNFVRYWRPKVATGEYQDVFLRPNGKPFKSKYTLRTWLRERVQPKFPWFHPYQGRHWSVTARLIDWDFDYNRVADWHGHEDVNMTRREYEHNTRLLKHEHGGDWIARAGRKRSPTDRRSKIALSVEG